MEVKDDMQQADPQAEEQQKEKEYLLPDGFGLDLDEVRAAILKKYDIKIDKDDPVLMIVPILNAALHEQKKQNEAYAAALEKVYQQVLTIFLENLDKRLQSGDYKVTTEETKEKKLSENWMLYAVIAFLALALIIVYFWK